MPTSTLSLYQYDALNRQVGRAPSQQPVIQHFHCNSRLATEIQGAASWSIVQHNEQLLALQQSHGAAPSATLLATDQQRSVLHARAGNQSSALTYTAYGHHSAQSGLLSLLGFNGERPDPVTGHYHLGNGYRQYNPVLMRFNSPDSSSPFGEGGINAYGYCDGEPIGRSDPTGHASFGLSKLWRFLRYGKVKAGVKAQNINKIAGKLGSLSNKDMLKELSKREPVTFARGNYSVSDRVINHSKNNLYVGIALKDEHLELLTTRKVKIDHINGTYRFQKTDIHEVLNVEGYEYSVDASARADYANEVIKRSPNQKISFEEFESYKKMSAGKLVNKTEWLRKRC